MRKWTQLLAGFAAAATLAAIGLTPASAAPSRTTAESGAVVEKAAGAGTFEQPTAELALAARARQAQAAQAVPFRPARTENVYVPITTCRIVDTRAGGGKIGNLATRYFYVRGTTGFAPQGGQRGGCGVPDYATSVTTNVTVTGATGSGYLSALPHPTTSPLTNFVTYWADRGITVTPTFTLLQSTAVPPLGVKNFGSPTSVIIDVTGYYMPPIEGLVVAGTEPYQGSTRLLGAVKVATGVYNVTVEGDVSNCAPFVTPYYGTSVYASAYTYGSNIVRVYLWTLNSTGGPVAYNGYFYLYVAC